MSQDLGISIVLILIFIGGFVLGDGLQIGNKVNSYFLKRRK